MGRVLSLGPTLGRHSRTVGLSHASGVPLRAEWVNSQCNAFLLLRG